MAHWYLYDGVGGDFHKMKSLKAAIAKGEDLIEEGRGYASSDGWSDCIGGTTVFRCETATLDPDEDGIAVYEATEIILQNKPDDLDEDGYSKSTGDWWNDAFDYLSDYKMQPAETTV